jgi:hypothetical protein
MCVFSGNVQIFFKKQGTIHGPWAEEQTLLRKLPWYLQSIFFVLFEINIFSLERKKRE